MVTRRGLLTGAAAVGGLVATGGVGYGLVEAGMLPGKQQLDRRLGRCDVSVPSPRAEPGPMVTGEFDSAKLGTTVPYAIAYPPGHRDGAALDVCVLLHGSGWRHEGWFDSDLRLHRHLADAVAAGTPPFALAACDGGSLNWHPRASGEDPQGAVVEEFLPLLARRGLRTGPDDASAVLGCSMGGYGALLFAQTWPDRFRVAVASSPALWVRHPVGSGAFDSRDDFARHDVIGHADRLRDVRLRIDCGESDQFLDATRTLRGRLAEPADVHLAPGCHDPAFWQHVAPAQLRFTGTALAGV